LRQERYPSAVAARAAAQCSRNLRLVHRGLRHADLKDAKALLEQLGGYARTFGAREISLFFATHFCPTAHFESFDLLRLDE
jgi:hypothetical protein